MTQAKDTIKTPYGERLAKMGKPSDLTESAFALGLELYTRQIAWREGFLAHGAEAACGNEDCACCQRGIDIGLDRADEGKTGARP